MKKKNLIIHLCLILIAVLFYFVANFQRTAVPGAVFDILENELNVTAPYITAFAAIFMYVYAIGQLIIGVLVNKYGGLRVISAGGLILAIGCILFPLSHFLPVMYISRALMGFGSSFLYLSIITELKNLCSEKNFGIAISVMLFIGYAGGIVANAPFVALMKYMYWRDILLTVAACVVVALIVFVLFLPKAALKPIDKSVELIRLPFRLVLHKEHNRNLFTFACCNFGISYVIQTTIGKKFLEDFCVYSSVKAATVLSIMAIVAAIFNIVNASVCKMCDNHRVFFLKGASVVTFLSLLCICIMIFFNIKSVAIPVIFCVLAGNASLSSLLIPVLYDTNINQLAGTAISFMNFCFFMMVGILGTLTGFVLKVFEPERINGILVYGNKSYLLLFGIFLSLSLFEMVKASKLSNKF